MVARPIEKARTVSYTKNVLLMKKDTANNLFWQFSAFQFFNLKNKFEKVVPDDLVQKKMLLQTLMQLTVKPGKSRSGFTTEKI